MAKYIKMPIWLQIVIALILLIGVACLAVLCIAVAKDMTFVEYIKSWFEKTPEVVEPVQNVVASFVRLM